MSRTDKQQENKRTIDVRLDCVLVAAVGVYMSIVGAKLLTDYNDRMFGIGMLSLAGGVFQIVWHGYENEGKWWDAAALQVGCAVDHVTARALRIFKPGAVDAPGSIPDSAQGASPAPEERQRLSRLVRQLGDSNKARREKAEHALRDLGSMAVGPLTAAIAKRAQLLRGRLAIGTLLYLAWISSAILAHVYGRSWDLGGLFPAACTGATLLFMFSAAGRQRGLINALADIQDKRAVGPLAEFISHGNEEAVSASSASLARLLLQLQASDPDLLSEKQRDALRRCLRMQDIPLTLAILKAFEQIGDERHLPAVEKISSAEPNTSHPTERLLSLLGYRPTDSDRVQVKEAAEACLPYLLARAEQQRAHQTLLRASDSIGQDPASLLRPASGQEPSQPQVLLRAVASPEETRAERAPAKVSAPVRQEPASQLQALDGQDVQTTQARRS